MGTTILYEIDYFLMIACLSDCMLTLSEAEAEAKFVCVTLVVSLLPQDARITFVFFQPQISFLLD
jgi:hypothetical protein